MRHLYSHIAITLLLLTSRLLSQPIAPPPSQKQIITWSQSNNLVLPYHFTAALEAQAYANNLIARGGTNMITADTMRFLQGGLSAIYNAVGSTSLIDAAFFRLGWNMTSGTQALTLRGRIGFGTNTTFSTNGLVFTEPSSMEFWHMPDTPSGPTTVVLTVAGSTNAIRGTNASTTGYRWLFSQISTNGYTAGARIMISAESGKLVPYTYNAGSLAASDGMFSRYYNPANTPGISQGGWTGEEQMRTVIVASDGTNIESWVDGLLAQRDTSGNLNSTNWCGRWQIGNRSDGGLQWIGTLESVMVFNRMLTSNEVQQVDFATRIFAPVNTMVIVGDSISEYNYLIPGREWSAAAWRAAGRPASLRIFNHCYSGKEALQQLTMQSNSVPHRKPWNAWNKGHYFILAGVNDVLYDENQTNVKLALSNICVFGRSHGYTVHLCTPLPIGTNAPLYSTTHSNNVQDLAAWVLATTNRNPGVADYVWNFNAMITTPNDTNILYDALHPTLAIKDAIGAFVASNMFGGFRWLR